MSFQGIVPDPSFDLVYHDSQICAGFLKMSASFMLVLSGRLALFRGDGLRIISCR